MEIDISWYKKKRNSFSQPTNTNLQTLDAVIKFSDAMILALVFPNMIGLLLLFPQVKKELVKYLKAIGK